MGKAMRKGGGAGGGGKYTQIWNRHDLLFAGALRYSWSRSFASIPPKRLNKMKKFNVALVATAVALCMSTPVLAEDLVFTLTNGTHSVLNNFYTSPVGVNAWEDDVFGDQVFEPGDSMEITIADGRSVCDYDMRFEFQGDELDTTTDTQNLCELGEYTIHE